ncbi:MAG: 1-acyl-sn-glycerol-3-phosphate acyltransferase [Rickettsiales bacterium]|jgi:1-acyl-sn-glycerol-3-phosphate acyltransferase|nr:1-acyl-sn-glycerol-3-phosphate acyltransferase [Rickettsiales bacterium]
MPFLILLRPTPWQPWLCRLYFKIWSALIGIESRIIGGSLADKDRLLLVCNHLSYLDIFALGRLFEINFVAKDDIIKWPLLGLLARLGNTVFISRERQKARGQVDILSRAFDRRRIPLLVFPEGTSGNGEGVLPFKSSLFSMIEGRKDIAVQPMALAYTHSGARRLSREERAAYPWFIKEQTLAQHFGKLRSRLPARASVIIGEPIDFGGCAGRKEMAAKARDAVDGLYSKL